MFTHWLSRSSRIRLILSLVVALMWGVAPISGLITTQAAPPTQAACLGDIPAALTWLATLQNPDGGFTNGFQPESDLGTTADVVFAVAAASATQPDSGLAVYRKEGKTPLDYLAAQVSDNKADNAGKLGKLLLALAAMQTEVKAYAGRDLIADAQKSLEAVSDGSDLYGLSLALLGLHASGADAPVSAIELILESRNPDGGWGFSKGQASDTNTTALVLQALIAADAEFDVAPTLAYVKATQNEDTGWPYQKPSEYGTDSDANSTAALIQALLAAGEPLDAWGNPEKFLVSFQASNGAFTYQLKQPADNALATIQALPALCGTTLILSVP
jgi:hypothetical protein